VGGENIAGKERKHISNDDVSFSDVVNLGVRVQYYKLAITILCDANRLLLS
jgi:hypothetical protein